MLLRTQFVIPAKAGIQDRKTRGCPLDPRFRGGDDIGSFRIRL